MDPFGKTIKLTLFGASHAECVGFVMEGLPKGEPVDIEALRHELRRRSAAAHAFATPRHEADEPIIEGGIAEGVTTGEPIVMRFMNRAHDPSEYRPVARPSHADLAAFIKSGGKEDISGGGKYSGRMTLPLTAAGALCRMALCRRGVEIFGHVLEIGGARDERFDAVNPQKPLGDGLFPLVEPERRGPMEAALSKAREAGDTLSAEAEIAVTGLPAGLGEPLFYGVESCLSQILFMIPGLRAVEFGETNGRGSEVNDQFTEGGRTQTNRSGGINGGLTNGMPLVFRVRFRPVPSIKLRQTGFDLEKKEPVPIEIRGRHDTCILPRGLAAAEAAAAVGLFDLLIADGRFL